MSAKLWLNLLNIEINFWIHICAHKTFSTFFQNIQDSKKESIEEKFKRKRKDKLQAKDNTDNIDNPNLWPTFHIQTGIRK